jgi:tetratricopeptide (TPR) repeat protein
VRVLPESSDAWVNLARVRLQQRDYAATREALMHALTLLPGLPKALYLQGEVQRAASRFKPAEASYKAVLRSFPQDRMALQQLGLVLWEQDRAEEALAVIERLLAIDEANPQAWFLAINCYKQLGDTEGLAAAEEKLRFYRPDDDEWSRTGAARLEDSNLERLARSIHIHRQPGVEAKR